MLKAFSKRESARSIILPFFSVIVSLFTLFGTVLLRFVSRDVSALLRGRFLSLCCSTSNAWKNTIPVALLKYGLLPATFHILF